MTRRHAEIVIIGEDKEHTTFVRRFLETRGYEPRKLRVLPVASGERAGTQHVENLYIKELKTYRRRSHQRGRGLIAVRDADTTLDATLQKAFARKPTDCRVVVLLPRRNIETWVVFLEGFHVNEEDDLKNHPCMKENRFRVVARAGKSLAHRVREEPPAQTPPSLVSGWQELRDRVPDVS